MKQYQLHYTLKNPAKGEEYKTHVLEFDTRAEAEAAETDQMYWCRVYNTAPASKWEKKIVDETVQDITKTHTGPIVGVLDYYFETGMECMGLVVYEDGHEGSPNPNFDPTKPEGGDNFKNYKTHDAINFIERGDILELDGVKYLMARDRDFALEDGFRLSMYPMGFSKKELIELFNAAKPAKLWRIKKV